MNIKKIALSQTVARHSFDVRACAYGKECEITRQPDESGDCDASADGIFSIRPAIPKPQMFSTMVHELTHELLHWGDRRELTTKVVRETEAEAVAYVVCRSCGLECSTRASDYIQLWSGDDKILMQSLELIRTVASKIIAELEPAKVEAEKVAHVA